MQLIMPFLEARQPEPSPEPSPGTAQSTSAMPTPTQWEHLDEAARSAALGTLARLIARMLADASQREAGHD
jgi:hypothetical protein